MEQLQQMGLIPENCGLNVIEQCAGRSLPAYTSAQFDKFVQDIVDFGSLYMTLILGIAVTVPPFDTENMGLGLAAARCGVLSFALNFSNLIAASWWFAAFFGMEAFVEVQLDIIYPHACTCKHDVTGIYNRFMYDEDGNKRE